MGSELDLSQRLVLWRDPRKKMSWSSPGIIHLEGGDIPPLTCSDLVNDKSKCLGNHCFRN